jgi:hypothetical protein
LATALVWIIVLLAAWGIWLWQLDDAALTFDESATYFVAHRPLPDIISYLRGAAREHPPVYYLLIHGWIALAGTGEFALRFFSVAMAMVALALVGWTARLTQGKKGIARGAMPALFLVAMPGIAYYARDARMYTLCIVWAALSTGLFTRDWLSEDGWPRKGAIACLAAVHLLSIFTHYYLFFLVLVQPLVLLIQRRWRPFVTWCATHGLLAILGVGWLLLSPGLQATTRGLGRDLLSITVPTGFQVTRLLGKVFFAPVLEVPFRQLYTALVLAGLGMAVALWRRRPVGVWLVLALSVPLALAYQLPQVPAGRYVIYLTLPVALALGFLIDLPLRLAWPFIGRAAAVIAALAVAAQIAQSGLVDLLTFRQSHYGEVLETVTARARPGDMVLFYGPWQYLQFNYYDTGALPPIASLPQQAPPLLDPVEAEVRLSQWLSRFHRIWVLPASVEAVDPDHFVAGWLNTHAHPVWRADGFTLYAAPLGPEAPERLTEMTFGDQLRLDRVASEPSPIRPGDAVRLTLNWHVLRDLEHDVQLTLELVDTSGHVWARELALPGEWATPPSDWKENDVITDRQGVMIPLGTPPGAYTLVMTITDKETGEALEGGNQFNLLTVEIVEVEADALHIPQIDHPPLATFCAPDGTLCLDLVDCAPGGVRFPQGFPVPFAVDWRAPDEPLPDLQLHLEIVNRPWLPLPGAEAAPIVSWTLPLAPTYPSSDWTPGRLVTVPAAQTLPSDAPTGRTQVRVQVLGSDGAAWQTPEGAGSVDLFGFTLERRPALRRLPRGLTRVEVDFGDEVGLRGYRIEGEARPGSQIEVTYFWYAHTQPTTIYAVFNHLFTAGGVLVTQADGWPQEGRMLSIQWQPGDYIEDRHTVTIPEDAPHGPYVLHTGMYNAMTGDRFPALQGGERLLEDRVTIPIPEENGR